MMLIILNSLLVIILLTTIKLSTCPVRCASTTNDDAIDETDFSLMRKIFGMNLMEDIYAENGKDAELSPELKQEIEQRIEAFRRVSVGADGIRKRRGFVDHGGNGHSKTQRRKTRSTRDSSIEAEHFYLRGFRERGHVPVNFPIDICLLKVGQTVFAASLNIRKLKDSQVNQTVVSFYRRQKGSFRKYMEHTDILARNIDCISHAMFGFVAVVNYYDNAENQDSPQTHRIMDAGSPVFRIMEDGHTEIVQKFSQSNQNTVHMWIHGNQIYLTHTYTNLNESVANVCPLYRWSGYHFDVFDDLPCYNSIHIEPFTIEQTLYIAIANQMNDEAVDEDTFSDIFRFDYERQKFDFHQKIYIYSVSNIAYFFLERDELREHFLVTGNSRAGRKSMKGLDYDQHSIVYKFYQGYFVPFQKFELHKVKKFLPVLRENGEFLLLILCRGKPLQIYEYDGWKFTPSRIDYTRQAFAAGVSNMRTYRHIINANLIVIANKNLYGPTANIFSPLYGIESGLKDVYNEFITWCGETTDQLKLINLEQIYNQLVALPKVGDEVVKIDKDAELRRSNVESLRASVLRTDKFVFDQRSFDYLNGVRDQLESMKRKVKKMQGIIDDSVRLDESLELKGDIKVPQVIASEGLVRSLDATKINDEVQQARAASETDEPEAITLDRLIVDGKLDVKFLNGYAAETLLHTTDDLSVLEGVDLHVKEVEVKGDLYVRNLIDGVRFTPDNVLIHDVDQVFTGRTLLVDQLKVNNLTTKMINSTDIGTIKSYIDKADAITAARARSADDPDYPMRFKEIRVHDLELTGLLNEVDINYIDRNALKVVGDQVITGDFHFDSIVASNLITPNNRLSGIDLNLMVLTEPTGEKPDFTVKQDVQFINPVHMETLQVTERLNHIPVVDGELQILMLNSKEPQHMTGTKTFDNVELLEPIQLQGRINSSSLSKMNPITTITQDIFLEGDFEITGDVTVTEILNATNIYGASRTYNYADLYLHGLPLNAASSDQNFTFQQPLIVQHAFTKSLNDMDASELIPTNTGKIQYITGRKTFTGDLTVLDGHIDAVVINKVDLKELNRTTLKRTGNQVIEGKIHFKEIIASGVNAKQTFFEDRPLSTLLTSNTKQWIKSKVRLEKCKLTIRGNLNVVDLELHNGSTIYSYDLEQMLADTLRKDYPSEETVVVSGPKNFYNVTVGKLILHDQATLNGVDLIGLKKIRDPVEKDIFVEDTLILKHPITVRNAFFNGSINGVRKDEFGSSWLLTEYNQTFTAPQIFENVIADQVYLNGYFNGVKLEELVEDVYFLNREEHVENAVFHQGLVSYQPVTVYGLVSGLNLSTDVLLTDSRERQYLQEVRLEGSLSVSNGIDIGNSLNGMNYAKLREFVSSSGYERPVNLEVHGNVHFYQQPDVIRLNGHDLAKLHRDVWLTNRDEVLTGVYRFDQVHFAGNVYVKGRVNNLDLNEICVNYMSVSVPQEIATPLIINGPVEFREVASFGNLSLHGLLRASEESEGINIVEFDKYVLKKDVEQTITGKWIFHDVEVYGNLNVTTLNGLDVRRDFLRSDATEATFTGAKRIDNLRVRRLNCPDPCIIQGVDFGEWFANAVRLDRHHTIEGVTYLESATVLGDIESLGPVNNITFNEQHLLLKSIPQTIDGDLYLRTKFPERNLIYPSSIENLEVETINGKDFNQFVENLARRDQATLIIDTPVTLTQPLDAENIDSGDNTIFGVNFTQLLKEVEYDDQLEEYQSKLRSLHTVGESVVENLNVKTPFLGQYQSIKKLTGHFRRVSVITLPLSPVAIELLVVHVDDGTRTAVEFYRWSKKEQRFRIAKGFPPIFSPSLIVTDAKRITLNHVQHLFVEFFDPVHHYYRQSILDLEPPDLLVPRKTPKFVTIYDFNSTVSHNIISFKLIDLDCVGLYSSTVDGMNIYCLHLENLLYYMNFQQALKTAAVQQAVHLDGRLILLSRDDRLQVWRPNPDYKLTLYQRIEVLHPSSISVAKFEHQLFIAVNSVHDLADQVHHGSIEIWRDARPLHRNSTFVPFQTILTKVPKQIQFSVIPSVVEMMLYTLNANPFHPFVVYRYEGVSGFREYLTSNVLRLDPGVNRLSVLKLNGGQRELVALVAPNKEIVFIEAVIK
ncbi:uncharacterized protein LOC129771448 [Toxorhynchites rutilus septentrionalis]|uniref:uncharacterized protein LOC129771448 n=1 Tax=Toxorhynchites rutilus septentrionalis TaxID=329112 RepID=UPI00247962CF|nr:uncharacterized protein LOC129771448 [Toxorhynchites rutilus septentrionalis]